MRRRLVTLTALRWNGDFLARALAAGDISGARLEVRALANRLPDLLAMDTAWLLPRRVVLWAFIRVMTHATTGPDGRQLHPDEVDYATAYEAWTALR